MGAQSKIGLEREEGAPYNTDLRFQEPSEEQSQRREDHSLLPFSYFLTATSLTLL